MAEARYSPDRVIDLTTRVTVFAQLPRSRYCPVTVPDELVRARSQASARRGGCPRADSLRDGRWLRDVVTERKWQMRCRAACCLLEVSTL